MTGTAPVLPCEAQIVFKQEPGQPVSRLVFSDWNLDPRPADAQFAVNVPQGYELIPIIERIPKSELKADPAKAMGAPAQVTWRRTNATKGEKVMLKYVC